MQTTRQQSKSTSKKARVVKTPKLLYTCDDYTIESIHLNFRIMILCAKRFANLKMERDWYSRPEDGIEEAHDTARYAIGEFFIAGTKPERQRRIIHL